MVVHTPSTAASAFSQQGSVYDPVDSDISPLPSDHRRREFKKWLTSTGYQGRYRSTENYDSLSRHDQKVFRSQMKGIFHHILHQMVPTNASRIWDDLVNDEIQRPIKTKTGYDVQHTDCILGERKIEIKRFFVFLRDYATIIECLRDAYSRAEHWSMKRQLLSIVAADMPTRLLKLEFPGLTDWKIKAARAQAMFHGILENICNTTV